MSVRIIGVDCATNDGKIRLALGELAGGHATVGDVSLCSAKSTAASTLREWIRRDRSRRTLIAVDAPLGWPRAMAETLSTHVAGAAISVEAADLFRRATDRFVYRQLKKTPLDVGADRIARTAHSALMLLSQLRKEFNLPIPLAWNDEWRELAAIEVYPAATLLARGLPARGYKKKHDATERERICAALRTHIQLPVDCTKLLENADALDAAVCVLAGADFLAGRAHQPPDLDLAVKEGWIWFRRPEGATQHGPPLDT